MSCQRRFFFLSAVFFTLSTLPITAFSQLCFDIFEDMDEPTASCADAFYSVNHTGSLGQESWEGHDLSETLALIERSQIFGGDPVPQNLDPYFAEAKFRMNGPDTAALDFTILQRGIVGLSPRDSDSQSASFGGRSRVTFIPITVDGSVDPVDYDLLLKHAFELGDPEENAGKGAASAGTEFSIYRDDGLAPFLGFNGFAQLDLANNPEPVFFGDFDDLFVTESFERSEPGRNDLFDVSIEYSARSTATPGEVIILDTGSYGSIFTDGFESGDTSAWTVSSENTFEFSISSPDPNVRFMILREPASFEINAGLNDAWVNADAALQGMFFTVFPDTGLFFLSWFTFDSVLPAGNDSATFGASDQRWVTGLGSYSGDSVTLNVELTSGGVFNGSVPEASQQPGYGTITIVFKNCNEAALTYNFPSVGLSGQMTLTRVLPDSVALCEALAAG
jgi:hypothetical protein